MLKGEEVCAERGAKGRERNQQRRREREEQGERRRRGRVHYLGRRFRAAWQCHHVIAMGTQSLQTLLD